MMMIIMMMVVMKKMIWKRVRGARSMSTNLRGGCCLFSSVCPPSAFVNIITVLVIVTVIIIIVGLGTRDVSYGQCPIFTFFTLHLNILGEYVVGKKLPFSFYRLFLCFSSFWEHFPIFFLLLDGFLHEKVMIETKTDIKVHLLDIPCVGLQELWTWMLKRERLSCSYRSRYKPEL